MHEATPHEHGPRLDDGRVVAEYEVVWLPPFEVGTIIALGLNAGDVVLAGSFTRPTTAVAGDNIHADYGPLGTISFRFV